MHVLINTIDTIESTADNILDQLLYRHAAHMIAYTSVNYGTETPRQVVKLPQKLEQIYSYNGKLYCLFESASFAYRLTAPVCMDRIVGLDEMALVE